MYTKKIYKPNPILRLCFTWQHGWGKGACMRIFAPADDAHKMQSTVTLMVCQRSGAFAEATSRFTYSQGGHTYA